jgi:hypothetical protein
VRLDHLLSKEHLQSPCRALCLCGGVVRSTPVAQTIVLRRVLTGGISADSGRRLFFLTQYGSALRSGPGTVPGSAGGGLVFGTLLGPEATGPVVAPFLRGGCPGLVFLVSWLHRSAHVVCVGCVVRGCCLRTT